MATLAPSQSIRVDLDRGELYFAIAGFWTLEAMQTFLYDLGEAGKPFMKERRRFDALGNLTDFVPQSRETADAIRNSLLLGQKNGLRRFAVVAPATLVKLQYRRLTEGLETEFFEDEVLARAWLRAAAQQD